MPKITQAQRETRRRQILDAALTCFSRDGFHNTTTADIVRESGVSQGTLYLYFATKDDIIVALADDRHQNEAFLNTLAQREQDPVRGLFALLELHGKGLRDASRLDGRRVGVQGWAEALRNPRIHDSVVEGLTSVREAIARLIERGQHTGQIRPEVDADALSRTLIAVFQGMVLQVAWGEQVDLAACGTVVREMIGALLTAEGRAAYLR
ncbi:MAG TPA: TetR/AcrR family transcriptional regulator [Aliidongia sp.]|nr:TetR/AcrR family transcriptional regulator [Aliidongia sp.]